MLKRSQLLTPFVKLHYSDKNVYLSEGHRQNRLNRGETHLNKYEELKKAHAAAYKLLPIGTKENFEQDKKDFCLTPENKDEFMEIGGGNFMRSEDVPLLINFMCKSRDEISSGFRKDKDGTGFIFDAFLYELRETDYKHTGKVNDAFFNLGLAKGILRQDKRFRTGFNLAKRAVDFL